MRKDLLESGVQIHFNSIVTRLLYTNNNDTIHNTHTNTSKDYITSSLSSLITNEMMPDDQIMPVLATGVEIVQQHGGCSSANSDLLSSSSSLSYCITDADAVIVATGHSARDFYKHLASDDSSPLSLSSKGFAIGFRIEHPQALINRIQYGQHYATCVYSGKRKTDRMNGSAPNVTASVPVASYSLAHEAFDGVRNRGVFSFCQCPGGQIVPASTNDCEVSINGMSFSKRDSIFSNSALVVQVDDDDEAILGPYRAEHGVLAGVAFQEDMERRAAEMGGGKLVVPVQRVTDFLARKEEEERSSSGEKKEILSSYRLGVRQASLHNLFPQPLTESLSNALRGKFESLMPGFICEDGILHGIESRTSSPIRIERDRDSYEAIGCPNIYPAGEGAGFAGGIVSAAADGTACAQAITRKWR